MRTVRMGLASASVLVLGGLVACAPADPVRSYVDEAIAAMQVGIYADTAEWRTAVDGVTPELYAADSLPDTYDDLGRLVFLAGGRHSFFATPAEVAARETPYAEGETFPVPTVEVTDGVGLITLPAFGGSSRESRETYRDAGIDALSDARSEATCGWIVDVRDNTGGNIWPMLGVVAPLLDEGRIAGFQDRDGEVDAITLEGGVLGGIPDDERFDDPGFELDGPVAVLTNGMTASAAELVVVAFQGQPDVTRIGTPTAGYTSGNELVRLSDGAAIVITTVLYVDRDGVAYDGAIGPDEYVSPVSGDSSLLVARASLVEQCS